MCAAAVGESPSVRFDVQPSIMCGVAASDGALPPGVVLLEARMSVSTFLHQGAAPSQLAFQLELNGGEQIVAYSPQTQLTSALNGPISVEKKDEGAARAGLGGAGGLPLLASGHLELGFDRKRGETVRYEVVAAKELLASAGTWGRGRGAYFKFRPSRQTSLEGAQELAIVFQAPRSWRTGKLVLHCRAEATRRTLLREETVQVGAADFVIPLYLPNDAQAHAVVRQYVLAENQFRRQALTHQRASQTAAHGLAGELSSLWRPRQPAGLPADWWVPLIFSRGDDLIEVADRLPDSVRAAAEAFLAAKRRLDGLRATDVASAP